MQAAVAISKNQIFSHLNFCSRAVKKLTRMLICSSTRANENLPARESGLLQKCEVGEHVNNFSKKSLPKIHDCARIRSVSCKQGAQIAGDLKVVNSFYSRNKVVFKPREYNEASVSAFGAFTLIKLSRRRPAGRFFPDFT
jgi:hypothetical protein